MRTLKRSKIAGLIVVSSFILSACSSDNGTATDSAPAPSGSGDSAPVDERTLTFGFLYADTHAHNTCGATALVEVLESRPEAGLTLDIFPGGQLGNEAEMAEAVVLGDQEMGLAGPNYLAEYHEPLSGIELAFLYNDMDHVNRVMNGEIGQDLLGATEQATGLKILGTWMIGNWQVYSNKPIRHPDDLAGLNLRMPPSRLMQANGTAMGANPTPVAFGEVYLALQQGVVDAASTTLGLADDMSWYEPVNYVSMVGGIWSDVPVIMNQSVWDSLNPTQQEALQAAVDTASDRIQDCINEQEDAILARWVEQGQVEVIPRAEIDIDAFRENARQILIDEFGDWVEEIYDRIRGMA